MALVRASLPIQNYISEHFDIPHIYPGDMLRKSDDPEVKALLAKGEFAPLDVVVKIIKQEIAKAPNGYILRWFPSQSRTVERNA